MKTKREEKETDIYNWKWSFKGKTPNGNIATFKGDVEAPNERMGNTAGNIVENMMREKYPDIVWMQGRYTEGVGEYENCAFGPTVQRGKFIREATNDEI